MRIFNVLVLFQIFLFPNLSSAQCQLEVNVYPSTHNHCVGGEIKVNAEVIGGGYITYNWYGPNSYQSEGEELNRTIASVGDIGLYTVVAFDPQTGCEAFADIDLDRYNTARWVNVEVDVAQDKATLTVKGDGGGGNKFIWGNGNVSDELVISPVIEGKYTVTVMDTLLGCIDSSFGIVSLFKAAVYDVEGNYYDTVRIGNQTWMKQNLRSKLLNDGSQIMTTTGTGVVEWLNPTEPYYFFSNKYNIAYGGDYNGFSAGSDKMCPVGWKVPEKSDFEQLITFIGADSAGYKLKAKSGWLTTGHLGGENGSDVYGFGGLYNEYRDQGGSDKFMFGKFWSSTERESGNKYIYELWANDLRFIEGSTIFGKNKDDFAIRCIKDLSRDTVSSIDSVFSENYNAYGSLGQASMFSPKSNHKIDLNQQVYDFKVTSVNVLDDDSLLVEYSISQNGKSFLMEQKIGTYSNGWNNFHFSLISEGDSNDTLTLIDSYQLNITGTSEIVNTISISPNPTSGIITVKGLKESKKYTVIDLGGKIIKRGFTTGVIDISDVVSGIYVIKIDFNNLKVVKK
jgi:uncharacterized protein (TIGR02145 family)